MKIYHRILSLLLLSIILGLAVSCEQETTLEDKLEQEKRFFELYLATHYPDAVLQSSGIYYKEHLTGTGITPDEDDWLLVNHVCYTIPNDNVYESYVRNVAIDNGLWEEGEPEPLFGPYKMQNGSSTQGLMEGLMLMKEGTQATILFTSDLGFGASGIRGKVGAYESLKYEIELLEVIKDIGAYEQARIDAYMDTVQQADPIFDSETAATMYCIIDQASEGDPVVNDSIVEIAYKGYLMDGRVFDERTADNPLEVTVGKGTIEGWSLGLIKLKVGEKARFVIPYQLAYGESGRFDDNTGLRMMPPYETLLFDVEVLSLREGDGSE